MRVSNFRNISASTVAPCKRLRFLVCIAVCALNVRSTAASLALIDRSASATLPSSNSP